MTKCYGCGCPDYRHKRKTAFCADGCVRCDDCTCFELAPPPEPPAPEKA